MTWTFFNNVNVTHYFDGLVDDFCSIHGFLDGSAMLVNEILKSM